MHSPRLLPIVKQLSALALPISAGRVLHILANFIAMMMVAELGKPSLAAAAIAASSTITIITLTSTIFYALGIRIRYHQGQQNHQAIGAQVKNGFLLALIIAMPAALLISQLDKLLLVVGQDPHLVALTHSYFFFAGLGIIPLLAMTVITQFYLGIGQPKMALVIEMISLPLMVFTAYVVIPGHFGSPAWGLAGISLANLITQSFILVVILLLMQHNKSLKTYQLFKHLRPNWSVIRSLLQLGLPIGIQFGGELAAMALASYLMGYYGVDTLAALQLTGQYALLVIMINFGLSQALSLKISELYGSAPNDISSIKPYLHAAVGLLVVYLLPIGFVFVTCASYCAKFYMGVSELTPDFEHLIQWFFMLSAVFLLFDGLRNLFSGALRGLHDTQTATRINLISLWLISLPLSAASVFVLHAGPIALRMSFLTGFLVAVVLLLAPIQKRMRNHQTLYMTTAAEQG